jgi:hypothetical protein
MALNALAASLYDLAFGLAIFTFIATLLYLEVRVERRQPQAKVEVEEYEDAWPWPERNVGPPARTHVGKRAA